MYGSVHVTDNYGAITQTVQEAQQMQRDRATHFVSHNYKNDLQP